MRRQLLKMMATGTALAGAGVWGASDHRAPRKRHLISLCWDDGFKKSTIKTAEIYKKHGLQASFNVIASGHFKSFTSPDAYQVTEKGDFALWNELRQRGHEIMPHGYKHANLGKLPLDEAQHLISICLDYFTEHLEGFRAKEAVFHFPYNSSTPELEAWVATKLRAFRSRGAGALNPLPHRSQIKLSTAGFGPGNAERNLEDHIANLLTLPEGWLVYNLHGLDGEGWGPVRSEYLDNLLPRLAAMESVEIISPAAALYRASAQD